MCKCDRELLELAARAAGMKIHAKNQAERDEMGFGDKGLWIVGGSSGWNPLTDDGDALRLAVKLGLGISFGQYAPLDVYSVYISEIEGGETLAVGCIIDGDGSGVVRRAIVRAAAAIGETLP